MEIFTAVVMGVVAGLLLKALFLKDSHILWDAGFGAVGGLAAYYISTALTDDVTSAIATVGTAVIVAGILNELWTRFGKTA
ncbi:MAG: hypothetical protein ABIS18_07915 [Actinomycetota bacterium]